MSYSHPNVSCCKFYDTVYANNEKQTCPAATLARSFGQASTTVATVQASLLPCWRTLSNLHATDRQSEYAMMYPS